MTPDCSARAKKVMCANVAACQHRLVFLLLAGSKGLFGRVLLSESSSTQLNDTPVRYVSDRLRANLKKVFKKRGGQNDRIAKHRI